MTVTQAAALASYSKDRDLRAAKRRLGEALPEDGWLYEYLSAVTPLTDAPVEFHLASGLCAIAAALGNRIRVESWGQNVFPHLWAVLVAPSSFWRKSTSINTAESLLREAVPDNVLPSEFSREAMLENLAKQPAGMFAVKEFGGFLSMLGRDYMAGSKENLTELYDGPDLFVRALKKSTFEIRRPAVTILGATTLDWLESRITEGDLRGGFLARFLFVTARDKASGKGITAGMDYVARMRLRDGLAAIAATPVGEGLATYGPGALDLLNEWMHGWEDEVGRTHHRSDLSGFAVRLQTYALKLAMLYRASAVTVDDEASLLVLDELSVQRSIAYCRVLWASVAGLIDDEIAITKESKELRRIKHIIGSGISRSDALRLAHMKARDFDSYLDTLVQSRAVVRERRRASEVGLDRAKDREIEWLSVRQFATDPSDGVLIRLAGTGGEPKGASTESEPDGAYSRSNTSLTSLSLTSLSDEEDVVRTHARSGTGEPNDEDARDPDSWGGL